MWVLKTLLAEKTAWKEDQKMTQCEIYYTQKNTQDKTIRPLTKTSWDKIQEVKSYVMDQLWQWMMYVSIYLKNTDTQWEISTEKISMISQQKEERKNSWKNVYVENNNDRWISERVEV